MTARRRALLISAMVACCTGAGANTLTIKDGRLRDVASSIRVGSGYSVVTNRVHGTCFEMGPSAPSTYYGDYDFIEVTPEKLATLDNDARDFVMMHRDVKVPDGMVMHELLGVLTVDEVSAPLANESKGPSEAARNLMRRGDLTGFLAACGSHYVRSTRRRSRFLTLFSYLSKKGETRDAAFERELELAVTAFDTDKERSATEASRDASMAAASMARSLRISVSSVGLGPRASPILPYDLVTYRAALQDAYKATQFESVGDPIAIEIAPWVALPNVLEALDSVGHGATFAQKQLLREVADFYLEILQHTDEARAALMRAKHCRGDLDEKFREADGALRAGLETAEIVREDGTRRPLADLIAVLADDALASLERAERAYTMGGVGACLAKLEQGGLKVSPSEIPECTEHKRFAHPSLHLIEHYCPARLYIAAK